MNKLVGLGVLCASLGFVSVDCAAGTGDDGDADLDEAVSVAALEQGQDGSEPDFADATEAAPALERQCKFSDIRKQLVASYDVDHDGELSDDERAELREDFGGAWRRLARRHAAREARRGWLRVIYDADGSGKLDAEERTELRADLDMRCEQRMAALTAKFDANSDGSLDETEWRAVREDLAARFAKTREAVLQKFDANTDGKLDASERIAALDSLHDSIEAGLKALVGEYDTDDDGKLSGDEKTSMYESLKEKIRQVRSDK